MKIFCGFIGIVLFTASGFVVTYYSRTYLCKPISEEDKDLPDDRFTFDRCTTSTTTTVRSKQQLHNIVSSFLGILYV
jgi:hypothetical protein